ncbi:GL23519 [Drosophila persimilis]|uniref:GL23519 n=1 Tax=Drosophila persimilis TaxID=7234 RepID=B4G2Z9_DROPE|nr:GL23519 [Drosophila persimilis]
MDYQIAPFANAAAKCEVYILGRHEVHEAEQPHLADEDGPLEPLCSLPQMVEEADELLPRKAAVQDQAGWAEAPPDWRTNTPGRQLFVA